MHDDPLFIDSEHALQQVCGQLHGSSWLAVDTEFERVNTYYPEWCLLQLGDGALTAVIDPLAISDLNPLYELLYDPAIIKVFHAARQDLELFYHIRGRLPGPLFDTQIAAALLGYDRQIGYAALVQEILGIELDKSQARTDWKRRPLHRNQLRYAADDVIYLGRLYEILQARLAESAQLAAFEEEVKALDDPLLYEPDPQMMWKKIRESKRLQGEPLAILQRLAAWREQTARAENRPRKWILPDHSLLEMARLQPDNKDALSQIAGMNRQVLQRHGTGLLQLIGDT